MEGGGGAAMARMEGRASIDSEPKTLNFHQIKLAREAALYVVNACTVEEASRIFTEGLEPVNCCGNGLNLEEEPNDDPFCFKFVYTTVSSFCCCLSFGFTRSTLLLFLKAVKNRGHLIFSTDITASSKMREKYLKNS
ncbi:hypothetical protein BT93_H3752 [Corymbia citriodora subsp. variegata]|nr:hypothetical protein BT93_H3752 [Corymbia citriodora subsp. variegata]